MEVMHAKPPLRIKGFQEDVIHGELKAAPNKTTKSKTTASSKDSSIKSRLWVQKVAGLMLIAWKP